MIPLSYAQQRLWFLHRSGSAEAGYNIPIALRLRGRLDRDALAGALSDLLERHESLRTVLPEGEQGPYQQILPVGEAAVPFSPRVTTEAELAAELALTAAYRFDLCSELPLRVTLFELGRDEHALLLLVHHVAADGWSIRPLAEDLLTAYRARQTGGSPEWAELAVQYADYALWQRELLGDSDDPSSMAATQLRFWRATLADLPEEIGLPFDRPRPAIGAQSGDLVGFRLAAEQHQALLALAHRHRATLFMVLHAGLALLLTQLTGRTDIPLGSVVAGRSDEALNDLIGFFVNTLVLRTDAASADTVEDFLEHVRAVDLAVLANQDIPFDHVVEAVNPTRSPSRHPLFQVAISLENNATPQFSLPGLRVSQQDVQLRISNFDLSVNFAEEYADDGAATGIAGYLEYDSELWDRGTAERMVQRLTMLFEVLAAQPATPWRELPRLPPCERVEVLRFGRGTPADPRAELGLPRLFAEQVARTPDAPAVTDDCGTLSYAELDRHSDRFAARLRPLLSHPEQPIAVLLERSTALVIALLGIVKAAAVYVPLPADTPTARLGQIAELAGCTVLVTDPAHAGSEFALGWPGSLLRTDQSPDEDVAAPVTVAHPEQLAYVMHTSGSTGVPKNVAATHRGVALLALDPVWDCGPGDAVLLHAPHAFDASTYEVWTPLLSGAEIVLAPPGRLDAATFERLIVSHRISCLHVTAGLFRVLAEEAAPGFAQLRRVFTGGDVVSPAAVRAVLDHGGPSVHALYGPTEVTMCCTGYGMRAGADVPNSVPIGSPLSGRATYLLDDRLQPVPVGVVGELYVGGPGLARGYLGAAGVTAERFVADPFAATPGARLYRTGDRVRWRAEGVLEFLGRNDSQVKIRGFRVEPAEVEALLAADPQVAQAAVVVREDAAAGKRLVGYLVPAGAAVDPLALRDRLASRLPEYAVPSVLVSLPRLPVTANGKLDRDRLPEPVDSAAPADSARSANPLEEILRGLFAELLGLDQVGADANFFDAGGHSLLATRLVNRLRKNLGMELGIRDFFAAPTPAGLAAVLTSDTAAGAGPRPAVTRDAVGDEPAPLSFSQRRLWFLSRLEDTGTAYHLPLALHLRGRLDAAALRQAVQDLTERHESLRTVFPETGGVGHQQVVEVAQAWPLKRVDVPGDLDAALERAIALPFDLTRQTPFRSWLFRAGADEHVLLLVLHHIAGDGWSMQPLARDLAACYRARTSGVPVALPALPVRYTDFARWQQRILGELDRVDGTADDQLAGDSSVVAGDLAYWREALTQLPVELELPTDHWRPAAIGRQGGTVGVHIPAELHARLLGVARRSGATLFMVLHAGLAALFTRIGAGNDIPLGTVVAGRSDAAVEDMVGVFLNLLVLRVDTSGDPSFAELLARVRGADLAAYAHQEMPFELLVERLNPPRSLSRTPLFQTTIALQNNAEHDFVLDGVEVRTKPAGPVEAQFDLSANFVDRYDADNRPLGIEGDLVYSSDLFEQATVARVARQYTQLLEQFSTDPALPISAAELLQPAERQQLLRRWSGSENALPESNLVELFRAQVARTPNAGAVRDGDRTLSYVELDRASDQVAAALLTGGLEPEQPVALLGVRSAELVVATLGIAKSGGCYVPLADNAPLSRLRLVVQASGARLVLVAPELAGHELLAELDPDRITVRRLDEIDPAGAATDLPVTIHPDQLLYAIFTSGSTGTPKGVGVTHRNMVALVTDQLWGPAQERVLMHSPHAFDASSMEIWVPLVRGGEVVVAPPGALGPAALAELVATRAVTAALFTPAVFNLLVAEQLPALRGMRQIWTGGDVVSRTAVQAAVDGLPDTTVVSTYGPTETTVICSWYPMRAPHRVGRAVPIGRPMDNTRFYVLDERLQPVPVGVLGELYIAGAGAARGYLHRPDLTAERFVADPFGPDGSRMYRSGDLVRWTAEGVPEFLGRADFQVKVRGFRVEPAEIEAALATLPELSAVVVQVREDRPGDRRLVAYVVAAPGSQAADTDPARLRGAAANLLPDYMVPSAVVTLPALPMTPNGKVDRRALPAPVYQVGTAEPRTPQEQVLCRVMAELLGLPRVGREDNFFELGGHSLLASELAGRMRTAFDWDGGVRAVFESPTPAGLAGRIGGSDTGGALQELLPLRARPADGETPAVFCLAPGGGIGWSFARLLATLPARIGLYALQSAGLTGPADLADSVAEIAERYLQLIRSVQPNGPYYLVGWSFGGVVAQAVAVKLAKQAASVGLLAVLDGYPAVGVQQGDYLLDADEVLAMAEAGHAGSGLDARTVEAVRRVALHNAALMHRHVPDVFDGDLLLCQAGAEHGAADAGDGVLRWRPFVAGTIEHRVLDCTHNDMTGPAALAELTKAIHARLLTAAPESETDPR